MANMAANVARYEEFEEHRRIREDAHPRMLVTKHSQVPDAIKAIGIIAVCAAMLALCISSRAQISSVHAEIVDAKEAVKTLRQENSRMKTEIEEKSSQKAVEEYAEKVLGMQKLERSQTEYITIDSGNVVEVNDKQDTLPRKIAYSFEKLVEKIRDEQEKK